MTKRQQIFGIDAIRFLAAVAVALFHLAYKPFALQASELHLRIGGNPYTPAWAGISWWGWIGVQIFFVISGLVIAYSAAGATPYTFFRSRVARLLPAMLICATFIAFVTITWGGASLKRTIILWIKSVSFFPFGPWLSGQFWTLGIEICFYGVVWLMIVFRSAHRLEALAWVMALASAGYWACISSGLVVDGVPRLTQLIQLQTGCYFAIGILLSIADGKGMPPHRCLLALICAATAWFQISATLLSEAPAYSNTMLAATPYAIWVIITAGVGASLYWKSHISSFVGSTARYWRAAGLATYPLYLIHMHAGGPIVVAMVKAGFAHSLAWISGTISSIAAAYVVGLLLEPPVHRAVLVWLDRLSPRQAANRP